jgi:hypothetical protein
VDNVDGAIEGADEGADEGAEDKVFVGNVFTFSTLSILYDF